MAERAWVARSPCRAGGASTDSLGRSFPGRCPAAFPGPAGPARMHSPARHCGAEARDQHARDRWRHQAPFSELCCRFPAVLSSFCCPVPVLWTEGDKGVCLRRVSTESACAWVIIIIIIAVQPVKSHFILHRRNLDSRDCVRLQLDHNASRACNHNAMRHLTSICHILHKFFHAWKKPLIRNFIVFWNGILFLGSLPTILGAKAQQLLSVEWDILVNNNNSNQYPLVWCVQFLHFYKTNWGHWIQNYYQTTISHQTRFYLNHIAYVGIHFYALKWSHTWPVASVKAQCAMNFHEDSREYDGITMHRLHFHCYNPDQNVWDKVPFSRIAAVFAPCPLPPQCMGGRGGGGGKVGFGPKNVGFHVKNWSMFEAVHSASLSHIILARIVGYSWCIVTVILSNIPVPCAPIFLATCASPHRTTASRMSSSHAYV